LLNLRFHCRFYGFTVEINNIKLTNVRSKINLCKSYVNYTEKNSQCRSKMVKSARNFQIFSICFLRRPVADRTDLHRYKICTFLKSRSNLQQEKVPYHFVGQPISLCTFASTINIWSSRPMHEWKIKIYILKLFALWASKCK
jgi:hypothetical protein